MRLKTSIPDVYIIEWVYGRGFQFRANSPNWCILHTDNIADAQKYNKAEFIARWKKALGNTPQESGVIFKSITKDTNDTNQRRESERAIPEVCVSQN